MASSFDEEKEQPGEEDEYEHEIADEYGETKCYQFRLDCCGRCCWLLLGFCIVAWVAHSISLGMPGDADAERWHLLPNFAKSLIWRTIAHHTEPWKAWKQSFPPPPPSFA